MREYLPMGVEHEPDRRSAGDPARPRFKVCGPMVDQVTDAGVRARLWPGRSLPVDDVLPLYVGYGRSSPESVRKINDDRQYAPATLRNRDLILDVLRDVLPMTGAILEIASGSGKHIVHFVGNLPSLVF